jgi:putative tryptophan/tyrosine transport system substrate-binding protein
MRRREFIGFVGGAAITWPVAARAQQSAMPVVGFLSSQSPEGYAPYGAAFRKALGEAGYVEGQNVAIEYRWARGNLDQLTAYAADLVRRQVDVIAATGGVVTARLAMAATTSIPIVFNSGEDLVQAGLVTSLNRPGGNVTGVSWFNVEGVAKRMALLHDVVPAAAVMALLGNPKDPEFEPASAVANDTARALGVQLIVLKATTPSEVEAAFDAAAQEHVGALVVASGAFFINQRAQLIDLAARSSIPCIYTGRETVTDGGLMSYGNVLADAYRRNALYVGRILKGEKPGDLPIDRSTKFELLINLKTAKALGLTVPFGLLNAADEVIE